MLDVLTASRSAGSYGREPMTAAEIDAHPDADRIWATVSALQAAIEDEAEERYEIGKGEGFAEKAGQASSDLEDFREALEGILDGLRLALKGTRD